MAMSGLGGLDSWSRPAAVLSHYQIELLELDRNTWIAQSTFAHLKKGKTLSLTSLLNIARNNPMVRFQ